MASVKIGAQQPAREKGGLPGYPLLCSVCGPIGSSSLKPHARGVAKDHESWHAKQGK